GGPNGGNGGRGSEGVSYKIASVTTSGVCTPTTTGYDYNLSGQTAIIAGTPDYPIASCSNVEMQMANGTYTTFGTGSTPASGNNSTVFEYSSAGYKTPQTGSGDANRYSSFINILQAAPDVSNVVVAGEDTLCCAGVYEYCLENLPNNTPVMVNWSLTTSVNDVASVASLTNLTCLSIDAENTTSEIQYAYLRAEISTGCCGIIKIVRDTVVLMPVPPEINQLSDHEICEGEDYTMSISVNEDLLCHPIYQWVRDGELITGANSNTYTISNATASMAGDYSIYVATDCGMEADAAHITVNPMPNLTVTTTPVCANEATHFTITSDVNTTITYNINNVNSGATQTLTLTGGVAQNVDYTIEHNSILTIETVQVGSCQWTLNEAYSLDVYDDDQTVFAGADFTVCGRDATLRGNSTVGSEWNGLWTIPNATDAANTTIADNTLYNTGVTYNGSEMPHSVTFRWTITSTHCGRSFYDEVTGTFSSLTLMPTPTNVVCNGADDGSITITATNGTPTYTYTWSDDGERTGNTANNLAPGTYTVTVSDANECSATVSATITEPDALVAYIDAPTNVCPEETVSITGGLTTAGTANYTYTWSTASGVTFTSTNPVTVSATSVTSTATIPSSCSGTYQINLHVQDAHGCTADATPINIIASVGNNITISGGTATKTVGCVGDIVAPHELSPSVMPTVTDACGRDISSSRTLTTSPNLSGITCEGTAAYVYTYTDCAGHTKTWTFTYTIEREDFSMPDDGSSTVACASEITAPTLPTVTDACGTALTGTLKSGYPTETPSCEGTVVYKYTFTDCAGNSHDWTY
ncbi:MAG: SprB repeat-containing protein, partial [Bacteroidales bacterium]|nr:SprB repeat-containing protein [Bacteroidales bacterium]